MFLRIIRDAITWRHGTGGMLEVQERYSRLLEYALEAFVARVSASEPESAAALIQAVEAASSGERRAVLMAPESSFRLLWPGRNEPLESARFLADALGAEHWRDRDEHPFVDDVWTATGDVLLRGGGGRWTSGRRADGLVLDLGSPHALSVDVDGRRSRLPEPLTPLGPVEMDRVLDAITLAMNGIAAVDRDIAWFVAQFTKVLLPLPDTANPTQFSSGSSGQFVGRTVLGNPHLASVTPARLSDALVHEAMHTLLYMDEQQDRWVLRPELYDGPLRITSPWTGASLPLRPYLQACFVWYGLLNYWSRAWDSDAFPVHEVKERISQALVGFLRGPLLGRVEGVISDLSTELVGTIEEMQAQVLEAWGDLSPVDAGVSMGGSP